MKMYLYMKVQSWKLPASEAILVKVRVVVMALAVARRMTKIGKENMNFP